MAQPETAAPQPGPVRALSVPTPRRPTAAVPAPLSARDLRRALDDGRVRPQYQPIVSLPSRTLIGFEALARVDGTDGAVITPDRFIAVAERSGLIHRLGARMLDLAVADAVRWRAERPHLAATGLGVNVAPAQLEDPGFPEHVRGVLDRHQLNADALVLEITEQTATSRSALPALHRLSDLGVRLALDDFGTGFSNLEQLRSTPVHVLKIDRSFVSRVTQHGPDQAIVRMIIGLAAALDLTVVAEGVETEEQADALHQLGCDKAQGYLFSTPRPSALAAADAVTPPRPAQPDGAQDLAWDRRTDAAVLAAARVLATRSPARASADHPEGCEDRERVVLQALVSGAARGCGLPAATLHAASRAGLVHDLARLTDGGAPPSWLRGVPLLEALATGVRTTHRPSAEVLALLAVARRVVAAAARRDPALGPEALGPALTGVARELVRAHPNDLPETAAVILARMATEPPTPAPVHEVLDDLEARRSGRRADHASLTALTTLATLLDRVGDGRAALLPALEEARRATGASAASLDRWDREEGLVRTLVNTGELALGESPVPHDEIYVVADEPKLARMLQAGLTTIASLHDATTSPAEAALLRRFAKTSTALVPLRIDGQVWGSLWLATSAGEPELTARDTGLLEHVARHLAIVVRHVERQAAR